MTREEALAILNTHVKSPAMISHSLASEAVLAALARRLGQDEQKWAMAGLLHDVDVEAVNGDMQTHGLKSRELLGGKLDEESLSAIEAHNEAASKRERNTMFEHALAAGETITGFITAISKVYPDKKVASVKVKSITKRMKERSFAASVRRENILECEKLGLSLEEFAGLSLKAMQEIAPSLGL